MTNLLAILMRFLDLVTDGLKRLRTDVVPIGCTEPGHG